MTLAQRYARWWVKLACRGLGKAFAFGLKHDREITVLTIAVLGRRLTQVVAEQIPIESWAFVPTGWEDRKH